MKRILTILAALPLLCTAAFAQGEQGLAPLPNDPAVRIGHLDNGLTYYIRHNELPKGRAEFYLAKNSWGTGNRFGGYMYLSEDYVRMKTICIVVHRDQR